MFYWITLLVVVLDQGTKLWVRLEMTVGQSIPLWDGFQLTYYRNSGAMGSSFEGYGRYFIIPAVLVVFWLVYMLRKGELDGKLLQLGAACFAGGAIGNAIDRAIFGWVTDFIDMGRGISNLADHALNLGILFFVLSAFVVDPWRRRRAKKSIYS
ncbi:signal peptidase II [Paenibacillus phyllosphaerae]|uniref:Lipoprotein signal peptidase n=1 Tax=Paenibacillus phyllosphaerae TaxID=274593 RepID=A0A7W5FP05_9BACL|nr:signal peptidase II [Paenibacillus phyllosphaerae]